MAKVPTTTCIWSTIWGPKPRGLEGMCYWSSSSRNAWSCQVTATMTISCSPPRLGFRKAYQGTTSTQKFKPCANNAARFFSLASVMPLLRDSYLPFKSCQIYHQSSQSHWTESCLFQGHYYWNLVRQTSGFFCCTPIQIYTRKFGSFPENTFRKHITLPHPNISFFRQSNLLSNQGTFQNHTIRKVKFLSKNSILTKLYNFLGKSKLNFWTKMNISNSV